MSIRVMNWVWEHSHAAGSELLLLLAIADAADDQGRNAYPSISTLAAKTRMSRRTVQRLIAKLVDAGHLVVITAGGRRSNSYAITFDATQSVQDSTTESTKRSTSEAHIHSDDMKSVPDSTPQSTPGVNLTQRQNDTGDNLTSQGRHSCDIAGVSQLCHPTHPVPIEPSTRVHPRTRENGSDSSTRQGGGGTQRALQGPPAHAVADMVADVLESLGPQWRIGRASAKRLEKPLSEALEAGWSAENLAEYLRANPAGVKSSYAVLAARLGDLPEPPAKRREWPAWCGVCDEAVRMCENEHGLAYRCPTCHPAAGDTIGMQLAATSTRVADLPPTLLRRATT